MADAPTTPESLRYDNGFMSRKLHLTLLAMFLVIGAGVTGHWLSGVAANLQTIVGGILGALAIFVGGNVATKFTASNLAKVIGPMRQVIAQQEKREDKEDAREDKAEAKEEAKDAAKEPGKTVDGPPVETG